MSSEKTASAVNILKGDLAAGWNLLEGSSADYTDLGIARRFGGSAAAYSLRDIGAMNGRVVKVRRDSDDTEEDFSANQVASGALETWVQDGADYDITNGDFDKTFDPTADGTFTPNGKDGFTLAVVSNTVYAGIKLNADVTSGDAIYVSFNCSFDAGSPSPKIALRNTDSDFFGSGTLMSNEGSVVNGFNSFTLTSTNSSASGVVLSEADNNLTYSISDFKVSRIARNGFVETLYDQSGNGDDMTQATAGSQPAIVQNGGQVKLICGKPAFKGDGTDNFLEASYFYSAGEVTAMSTFSVVSNLADTGTERTIISAGSGVSTTYPGFNTALDKQSNSSPFEQRVANASGAKQTSLTQISQDGDILGSTFFTKDGTHLIKATTKDGTDSTSAAITVGAFHSSSTSGKLRIGATRTFTLQRFFNYPIAETMVFRADLRDEGIEDEINQFYNIG